jgi:hypothetical protein
VKIAEVIPAPGGIAHPATVCANQFVQVDFAGVLLHNNGVGGWHPGSTWGFADDHTQTGFVPLGYLSFGKQYGVVLQEVPAEVSYWDFQFVITNFGINGVGGGNSYFTLRFIHCGASDKLPLPNAAMKYPAHALVRRWPAH